MKIVFLSHTYRDCIYKVGSYFISKELAKMGHEILYISDPVSYLHKLVYTFKSNQDFSKRYKLLVPKTDKYGIINYIPMLLLPTTKGFIKLNNFFNVDFSNTKKVIKDLDFEHPDLILQDSISLSFIHRFFNPKKLIYRVTDLYSEMPNASSHVKEIEHKTIQAADDVLVTSHPLQAFLQKNYGVKSQILINGVDFDLFSKPMKKPALYNKFNRPIVVYAGSLDERFDTELIEYIAKNNNVELVLIGREEFPIKKLNNIHMIGSVDHSILPSYLQHASVGILPFKLIEANHKRSPMKIYEYGASGLPVVSTNLQEIRRRINDSLFIGNDYKEFSDYISLAIKKKKEIQKIAIDQSSNFSWVNIAKNLMKAV